VKIQQEFLSIFQEKGINTASLHVYLAGGIKSHFASKQTAEAVKQFWIAQRVTLNTDLLLSRDFIAIDEAEEFGEKVLQVTKMLCERDQLFTSLLPQLNIANTEDALKDFIRDIMNTQDGMIYAKTRRDQNQYSLDTKRNQLYCFIEITIGLAIKEYLKIKKICHQDYIGSRTLLMTHNICNPLNKNEKRVAISFHDPFQCVLHLVGFDINNNRLFICTDDCTQLSEETYKTTQYGQKYAKLTTIPIYDLREQKELAYSGNFQGFGIFPPPPNTIDENKPIVYSPPTPY